jgi:hypothetical protein
LQNRGHAVLSLSVDSQRNLHKKPRFSKIRFHNCL